MWGHILGNATTPKKKDTPMPLADTAIRNAKPADKR
jgi:hypothetical protein